MLPLCSPVWDVEDLQFLNARFGARPAEDLLSWAARHFGGRIALTCSFGGAVGMVLLDMIARRALPIRVILLDTELLFPETYALVEAVERHYGITIERRRPALTLAEQEALHGPALYARDPDRCCALRKVATLVETLRPYEAWVSGIRRGQTAHRAGTELLQWNVRHGLLKLSPLAAWSERQVWDYIQAHAVPFNPLLSQGYPSLGCAPCTAPASSSDPRAGRWSGFAKTECGLHL